MAIMESYYNLKGGIRMKMKEKLARFYENHKEVIWYTVGAVATGVTILVVNEIGRKVALPETNPITLWVKTDDDPIRWSEDEAICAAVEAIKKGLLGNGSKLFRAWAIFNPAKNRYDIFRGDDDLIAGVVEAMGD
jgi:hypothetical protein